MNILLSSSPEADYSVATVAVTLFFIIMSAVAIFIFLRRAETKKKLLCFFIGVAVYAIPSIFLLTDINAVFSLLLSDEKIVIPGLIGCMAAVSTGVAFLGTVTLICSGRVMKSSGQIAVFVTTLLFFAAETALTYFSLLAFTGTNTAQDLSGVIPSLRFSEFGDVTVFAAGAAGALLYVLFFFLGFLFNKSKKQLRAEDIDQLHRTRAENARLEKEGICAVCRYADCEPGAHGVIFCDKKKKRVQSNASCRGFEYDPLKRIPEKSEKKEGNTND